MPDIDIDFKSVKPEDVQKVLDTITKVMKMGKAIATFTPTDLDDKVIGYAENILAAVAPYVTEEWFTDLLSWVGDMFKKDPAKAVAALKTLAV